MPVSRIAIQRETCRRRYAGVFDPVTGTNTSTTDTIITDTTGDLNYSSGDTRKYDGKHVYVTTSADAARGRSRVIRNGWAVTGSLTIDPAVTGLASGDLFILSDDSPLVIQQNIDRVLRNLFRPAIFPLSLHLMAGDDNDMESDPATNYGQSNGTRANETTIVKNGSQSLKLTATAANGRAHTGVIPVFENRSYIVAADCSVTQGDDAELRIVNVQNSDAEIDDAISDEPAWTELVRQFTTPSGCEQVNVWFISVANTDVTYWDDFQIWTPDQAIYPLPSWIVWPSQILDIREYPQGASGPASDGDYRAFERKSRPVFSWGLESYDPRADQRLRVKMGSLGLSRPYLLALRPYTALSADTTNTPADLDEVVEHVLYIMRNPEKADRYLGALRAAQLVKGVSVPSERVYV